MLQCCSRGLSGHRSSIGRQEVGKPKRPRSNSNAYAEALRSLLAMLLDLLLLLQKGLLLDMSHSWVFISLVPSGPGTWIALLVACLSVWVKLSFSLTFILYLCSFKNKPSQIWGSKSWSLYPIIFTAFQRLPGRSWSLRRLCSSSPQNPYDQLGNCSIVFKFALYTQQSRNSCFCFLMMYLTYAWKFQMVNK